MLSFKIEMALRPAVRTAHIDFLILLPSENPSKSYPDGSLTIYYPKQSNKVIEALTFTPLVSFNFAYPVIFFIASSVNV